ncbi:sensor histidine kinase [Firmicutes bacterium AM59-13]|jgi:signal transduction histidine kinase|nr:sensor histidine kinase [Firmicutes bacterium AM59-13]
MDNREENSRNTEQDRVDNPVENTVSTMVETALSENKRERKKREKAEKKKNAPAQGNSLLGSTLAKVLAFVLMIAAAIVGVLGLYGTCMLADSGAYSSGKMMFIHDQLLYRQVNQDLYRIRDWYENESLQTMEAYCRQRNIWVKVESYDLDTDEFLGEWKNEDYVDKTNDLTYRLESQVQHRNDNTYINTETSSASDGYESYGSSESSDITEPAPSVNTGSDVESITAAEQEALSSGNLEKYLDLGDSVSLGGEIYVPVERAEQYAKWMIEDALSETERLQEEAAEETLAERNKRIVVTLTANPSLPKEDEYALIYHQAEQLYDNRNVIPVVCCAGTVLAFLCFIFLLCSAGHKNGREGITPSAIHEIHLDVYTVVVAIGAFTGLYLAFGWIGMNPSMINLIVLVVLFAAEVIWCTLYFMELAIRLKMGKWWQNTILYRVFRFFGRFCKRVFRGIVKLIRGIPMVWRTALLCLAVCVVEFFGLILFYNNTDVLLFFWAIEKFILCGAITFVALMCKELQEGSEALADGDLNHKLDTSHMVLSFKEHGENLNRIGEGISAAVEQRMKSEHLKTELITNVSHDIKTPLTSIINYADLIGKEVSGDAKDTGDGAGTETAQEREQHISEYAEVLLRQSQKLKKLLDDLLEASKATTGNLEVHPEVCDVSVLLSQAVGEYGQRFADKQLETIVKQPEETVKVMADGRHLWRVFDNLLNNIYKYAQTGSRVYLNVEHDSQNVRIIFRNMSAYPLEMSPEELEERFTRGDRSRHMEGNGLGLSIAKSLTELQKGDMEIVTDGDLFKVVITLPETV